MQMKILRIEKDYFKDKMPLKQLIELCRDIKKSVDKLNNKQKEMLQHILCNSILAQEFEINEVLGQSVLNTPFYRSVATELVKEIKLVEGESEFTDLRRVKKKRRPEELRQTEEEANDQKARKAMTRVQTTDDPLEIRSKLIRRA